MDRKIVSEHSLYAEFPWTTGNYRYAFTELLFTRPKESTTRQEFADQLRKEFEYHKEDLLDYFYPHKKIPRSEPRGTD